MKSASKRFVVVGSVKPVNHYYSCKLGRVTALNYAIDCADHPNMAGAVYEELEDGTRVPVYTSKAKEAKEQECTVDVVA